MKLRRTQKKGGKRQRWEVESHKKTHEDKFNKMKQETYKVKSNTMTVTE